MIRVVIAFTILATVPMLSFAAGNPQWQAVLGDLVKKEKAGFGGLCGVVVDPEKGTVWINLSDRGFYKSDDQGKTFRRAGHKQPKGRTESPGCLLLDPTGKSKVLLTALVYGSPIGISSDGAESWKHLNSKSTHVDWCAVDWTDPQMKFVLTLKHESRGLLLASRDGGATFAEVGTGYGPGWVFDDKTAVVAHVKSNKVLRTTDGGQTWHASGVFSPVGSDSAQALPKWHGGSLYWLAQDGIMMTEDKGATWKKVSRVKAGRYGPIFGKSKNHLFVLTEKGIIESTDGGRKWSSPIPPPRGFNGTRGLTWLAYDPKNNVIYLMKMGSNLFKLER